MPAPPPKTPFRCPVCGFVQLEPPHLVSTNCRSCGAHYEASAEGVRAGTAELPNFAGRKAEPGKPVHCLKCGRTHEVSRKAQSTICPGCYAPIELIDVLISAHASRAVDTRGQLRIGPKGSLANPWIICGSARIEGPFQGHLRCEGEVRLQLQKPCGGRITAGSVHIDKKSLIDSAHLIEAEAVTVHGTLRGPVHCTGTVHILSGGRLEGALDARGLIVDKGGTRLGPCRLRPDLAPSAVPA